METSVVEKGIKLEPTEDQYGILFEICREKVRTFDTLHSAGMDLYINHYWCEGRKEGVKRLVNSLLIAQTFVEYDLDYHKLMDQKDIPECIDLLTGDTELEMEDGLRERFENSYPLLVDEDFTQIVSEYRAFFDAIDSVKG